MMFKDFIYKVAKPLDLMATQLHGGKMLEVGQKAPDFSVKTQLGDCVTLNQYKGKKIILWFYPKADTPGCTLEGCGFRDRIDNFKKKGIEVLGVSFDTPAENLAFAKKFGFPFSLLCDTERKIGVAYGACKSPQDKSAARIGYVINEKGLIEKAYPKVDAAKFPEQVLEDLAE